MAVAIAKTKAREAVEMIQSMDQMKLRKVSEFELHRFRKCYEDINDEQIDSYYFCKAFDAAIVGDRDALKKNVDFTIKNITADCNVLNIIKLCEQMGLYNKAAEIAKEISPIGLALDDACQIADSLTLVGLVDQANEALEYINKAYPEMINNKNSLTSLLIKEIVAKGIKHEELTHYWNQFEDFITDSIIIPKLFELKPVISLFDEVPPSFINIEFETTEETLGEDELWDKSDSIAKGLAKIDATIDVRMLFVSDISYRNEEAYTL